MPHHLAVAIFGRLIYLAPLVVGLSACAAEAPSVSPPTSAPAPAPAAGLVAPPTTEAEMLANAMAAGPEALTREAAIVAMDGKMQMKTLREGTNGWTCMPDNPQSPGVDPMCVDKNGLAWAMAWMHKTDPPKDKIGFGYMLLGGSDASNEDPHATAPAAGSTWVETGPHVMILNAADRMDGYPTSHQNTKVPYVMWGKTPYAHLMIPVR